MFDVRFSFHNRRLLTYYTYLLWSGRFCKFHSRYVSPCVKSKPSSKLQQVVRLAEWDWSNTGSSVTCRELLTCGMDVVGLRRITMDIQLTLWTIRHATGVRHRSDDTRLISVLDGPTWVVSHKNSHTVFLCENFVKCGSILIVVSLLHSEMNCGLRRYAISATFLKSLAAQPCEIWMSTAKLFNSKVCEIVYL